MAAADFAGNIALAWDQAKLKRDSGGIALRNSKDEVKASWKIVNGSDRDIREWIQKERLFVKGVEIENVKLDGLWRSSDYEILHGSGKGPSSPTEVTQTFRRGYASEAIDGEAFVDSGRDELNTQDLSFFVTWPNIAPHKVQSVMAEVAAKSPATDPKYGKTPLEGKFIFSEVVDKEDADGIHNVSAKLTKIVDVSDPITELNGLEHTEKRWVKILANGELENGREEGAELVWKGLNPENRAAIIGGIEANPSGFVNANIETVNPWSGNTVIGQHYAWQPDAPDDGEWDEDKRNLTVEARIVFSMGPTNYEQALRNGWVTQSWEPVLPVLFQKQDDGSAVLSVTAIDHRWKNLEFDSSDDPIADWVQDRRVNPEGKGAGSTLTARGVPTTASEAIAAAREPDEDNLIGAVSIAQSGSQAAVQLQQSRIWDYLIYADPPANTIPAAIQPPTMFEETPGANNRLASRKYTWKRVDPDKLDDHLTWARLYRANDGDDDFLLSFIAAPIHPDGARDVVTYLTDDTNGGGGIDTAWISGDSYMETCEKPPYEVYRLGPPLEKEWDFGESSQAPLPEDGRYWRLVWKEIDSRVTQTSTAAAGTVDPANDEVDPANDDDRVLVGSNSKPFRKGLFIGNRVRGLAYTPWFFESFATLKPNLMENLITTIYGRVGSLRESS